MAAQDSPLKQPMWLLSRSAGLEAAKEGSWHILLLKGSVREEEAAVIELKKNFLSPSWVSVGFKRRFRNAKSSGWPHPTPGLPSSVTQEPLLKVIFFQHFYSFCTSCLGC